MTSSREGPKAGRDVWPAAALGFYSYSIAGEILRYANSHGEGHDWQ